MFEGSFGICLHSWQAIVAYWFLSLQIGSVGCSWGIWGYVLSRGDYVGAHIMKEEATKSLPWLTFPGVSASPCFGQAPCPVHKGRWGRSTFQEWTTLRSVISLWHSVSVWEMLCTALKERNCQKFFNPWKALEFQLRCLGISSPPFLF